MGGSQHLPREYQIMFVGGVYELVWPSDKPLFREDNKRQEELVDFGFFVGFCASR
jgi:hypothetical protein